MESSLVREIPLLNGDIALVSAEDYDRVMGAGNWSVYSTRHTKYAIRSFNYGPEGSRRQKSLSMHRFITGWFGVDHANRNGLDNRRENLRKADRSHNMRNRPGWSRYGYKGVAPSGKTTWAARIKLPSGLKHLGTFPSIEDAARAYDDAAREMFGEFAHLNFPKTDE